MGAVLPISILGFFLEFSLQEFLINEKMLGRFEFLMANGTSLNDLWIGTALSIFIMNLITLLSMYILIIIIMLVSAKTLPYNSYFLVLWFVIYPLLNFCLSFLLSALGFIIKRGKVLLGLLMAFTLLFFFVGTYFTRHIVPNKIGPDGNVISSYTIGIFVLIIILLTVAILLLRKKITLDSTTLSIPD
jgi:hypothetical protein